MISIGAGDVFEERKLEDFCAVGITIRSDRHPDRHPLRAIKERTNPGEAKTQSPWFREQANHHERCQEEGEKNPASSAHGNRDQQVVFGFISPSGMDRPKKKKTFLVFLSKKKR